MKSAEFMQIVEKNPPKKAAEKGKIGRISEPILPIGEQKIEWVDIPGYEGRYQAAWHENSAGY